MLIASNIFKYDLWVSWCNLGMRARKLSQYSNVWGYTWRFQNKLVNQADKHLKLGCKEGSQRDVVSQDFCFTFPKSFEFVTQKNKYARFSYLSVMYRDGSLTSQTWWWVTASGPPSLHINTCLQWCVGSSQGELLPTRTECYTRVIFTAVQLLLFILWKIFLYMFLSYDAFSMLC